MTDISYIKTSAQSDDAILRRIGEYIRQQRLEQNKTQAALALEAGISRSTLSELENGQRSNLITLVQVLRALKLLQVLDILNAQEQLSPIQLAKLEQEKRKRASKSGKSDNKPLSDW